MREWERLSAVFSFGIKYVLTTGTSYKRKGQICEFEFKHFIKPVRSFIFFNFNYCMNFPYRLPDSIVDDEHTSRILLTITIRELELGSSASPNVEVSGIITLAICSRYSSSFLREQQTLASRVSRCTL